MTHRWSLLRPSTGARLALLLHLAQAAFYLQAASSLLRRGYARRADFTSFYTGWSLVADGLGPHLYDFALQQSHQMAIAGEAIAEGGLLPFLNPPHLVLPLVPLAWLPRPTAFALWTLLQLALTAVAIRNLWRLAAVTTPFERALVATSLVASPPFFHSVFLGSFSLGVLVCLAAMVDGLRAGRDVRAGGWLAVATIKPQMLVLVPFLLVGRRRWRVLGAAATVTVALVLLSAPVLGWRIWPSYLAALGHVSRLSGTWGIRPDLMYSLKGSLWVLVGSRLDVINVVCQVALAVAAVVTVVVARLSAGQSLDGFAEAGESTATRATDSSATRATDSFDPGLALAVLAGLFFAPHLHPQDGLLLALPLAMGWSRASTLPRWRTASAALILTTPLLLWATEFTPLADVRVLRMPTLLMAVIAVWLVCLAREGRRAIVSEMATSTQTSG